MRRERWRDVPGFDGHYQISSRANLRSVRRRIIRSNNSPYLVRGRVMAVRTDGVGGRTVTLAREGRSVRIHVDLVAAKVFGRHYEREETRVISVAS